MTVTLHITDNPETCCTKYLEEQCPFFMYMMNSCKCGLFQVMLTDDNRGISGLIRRCKQCIELGVPGEQG